MVVEGTFLKSRNVRFFLALSEASTIRAAAKVSGIAPQYGVKLMAKWRSQGLVFKNRYTVEGAAVASALAELLEVFYG